MHAADTHTITHIAADYNWWTPKDQKSQISLESSIAAIFQCAPISEVCMVMKRVPLCVLQSVFSQIQSDTFAMTDRRRHALQTLLNEKANGKMG